MADSDERTLDPTPRRRQQAREAGQIVQSRDLASATLWLGLLLVLLFTGGALLDFLARTFVSQLGEEAWVSVDRDRIVEHWNMLVFQAAKTLAPILAAAVALGVIAHLMQTGFLFLPGRLAPNLGNLSPQAGLRRIFSLRNAAQLGLSFSKLLVVGAVAYFSLNERREEILQLATLELPQIARFCWELCLGTGLKIGAALFVLGIADYGYARWKHERDLRMTPEELREELRNQGERPAIARQKQRS